MAEEIVSNDAGKPALLKPRPVILTMLCLVSFVYFGILSILCLAGLFYSGWISGVMNQYITDGSSPKAHTVLISGAGFLLHGFAFTGVLLIWNLRKTGYYFLGLSCLVIALYQLLNPSTAITSTAIYIIFLLLFGVFYTRLLPVNRSARKKRNPESS